MRADRCNPMTWFFLESAMEIFGIQGRLNRVDVAAQYAAGESQREEYLLAGRGIDRIVDAVVGVRGSDRAGANPAQLIRAADAFEIDVS